MIEIEIPQDRQEAVTSPECADWLSENAVGSALGHLKGGGYYISFTDEGDAQAFRHHWLGDRA